MKPLQWSSNKNLLLKRQRDIGFEEVEQAILNGKLLAVEQHSNPNKYPGQKILIVEVNNYAYSVPYKEEKEFLFLKTIFPNRKANKKYLKKGN